MASLMEELIATLRQEAEAYQELLPVVEQKTKAIIANDLKQVQAITELEQETIGKINGLEKKRTGIIKNIGIVLNKKEADLTLPKLIQILDRQPQEQKQLNELHKDLLKLLKQVSEVNGHNKNLLEQSLEMISYNMNLIQSTRIVPGNNYTKNAGQWDMTASQTGMFDAKQ
ncbi:MAG: flagellar protein FlgN [Lachnospiraceae bacterium]|nr:flagellar protein FlgN [Lachnospiraceae bacterium]MBP3610148.1 flagellar protein FlgN [Lachnospiraceae bacterium]